MEDDKDKSFSSKDRKMAGRFSNVDKGGGYEFFKDKDDDEEKKKKLAKKAAKKISFLSGEAVEPKVEKVETSEPVVEKKNPFRAGFLKDKEVEIDTSVDEAKQTDKSEIPDEIKEDFQEIVIDRLQEVEKELELPETEEIADEVVADAEFLEHVGERIEEGMEPAEAIVDALEDIYVPPEADAESSELEHEEFFESETEETDAETTEEEAKEEAPKVSARPIYRPPTPPVPPTPPTHPRPNSASPPSANVPVNSANVASNPNNIPMNEVYYRNKRSGDVLAGGLLGYLVGKRRGRKKTEGRLEPEIKKRDAELEELKSKLSESEAIVRAEATKAEAVEKTPEKRSEDVKEAVVPIEKITIASTEQEKQVVMEKEKAFEQQLEGIADADIEALGSEGTTEQSPNAVGTVFETIAMAAGVGSAEKLTEEVIETEKEFAQTPEKLGDILEKHQEVVKMAEKQRVEAESAPERKRDVRAMAMPELLKIAEHISLEKTSLRELYERNRIDAVNLRRVVVEYMNGGTGYQEVLRGSLEAVEMQRELRGEVKKESDFTTTVWVDDENTTQTDVQDVNSALNEKTQNQNEYQQSGNQGKPSEQEQDGLMLSNSTAIVLGIVTGVGIMILVFLYSSSI